MSFIHFFFPFQIKTQNTTSCTEAFKFVFGCFIRSHLTSVVSENAQQEQIVLGEPFLYGISFYIKFGAQTSALSSFLKKDPLSRCHNV